ncbi:hypothetical protein Mapa_011280 [Marchantia paleacea]|nr:hypothetical protein Mapa_011280 [Marchantia paleacea]
MFQWCFSLTAAIQSFGLQTISLFTGKNERRGTPRLCFTAPVYPSIQPQRTPYLSGFLGHLLIAQNHAQVAFAEASSSTSMSAMPTKASVGVGNEVVEPMTGIKFAKSTNAPGASKELVLAGAGVRVKKIFAAVKVKVYAVGLYVDPSAVSSLEAWKSKGTSEIEKDESFSKTLIDLPVEKSLRIVLARDIEGAQFWGALGEALAPRLKAAGAGAAGEQALNSFGDVFKNRALKERTVILLTWTQPSTLHISIAPEGGSPSAPDASIESAALLSSLYDVYLGKNPVSPSAKASIAKGIFSVA